MDLTNLLTELRSIEERMSYLQSEIVKMLPTSEEEKSAEYDSVTKSAQKFPVSNIILASEPDDIQKMYIRCLSFLTIADKNNVKDKLLYLCRIAAGTTLDLSAEEIYALGLSFEDKDLDECCFELKKLKYSLLTDAMIVANISEETTFQVYSLIADMAKLMELDELDVRVIAQVAKAVLTNNFDTLKNLTVPLDNRWSGQFKSHISNEWMISQRVKCCDICVKQYEVVNTIHPNVIKRKVKNSSLVKGGDIIILYETQGKGSLAFSQRLQTKTIVAPKDGIVFTLNNWVKNKSTNKNDKYVLTFVSSVFDEFADFYDWFKKVSWYTKFVTVLSNSV